MRIFEDSDICKCRKPGRPEPSFPDCIFKKNDTLRLHVIFLEKTVVHI